MRFSTIFITATLAALSAAQSNETASSTAPVVATTTFSLTPAQSSQASCLEACQADDPSCRAACIVVDEGDFTQQNRTIDCITECPKGNGTETDNLNFENCQKACIAETPASETATSTGSGAGASETAGSDNENDDEEDDDNEPTSTGSQAPSGTDAAAEETASDSAADNLRISAMGAVLGLGSLAFVFGL
jgi:hypothetical protein